MAKRAYLTIDDSPTKHTDGLTDWLVKEEIPAVIFAIGSSYTDMHLQCEGIEQNPGPIERAIEKDFLIANHTYSHRRASELTFEEVVEEIKKTEKLIDGLYRKTGKTRRHKMIRFPHLDRGAGANIIDFEAAAAKGYDLKDLFLGGLNIKLVRPTAEQVEKKHKIQEYLAEEGFLTSAFQGVTFDWYNNTEMAAARDALMTFSTSDWMMNPDFEPYRHQWPYRALEALKEKIDKDACLHSTESANIVLAHDHNNMLQVTQALIGHMKNNGIQFQWV
jgi:peptidoglycan/xylan/chitin deacetylase (PgdA/CDA1 family)